VVFLCIVGRTANQNFERLPQSTCEVYQDSKNKIVPCKTLDVFKWNFNRTILNVCQTQSQTQISFRSSWKLLHKLFFRIENFGYHTAEWIWSKNNSSTSFGCWSVDSLYMLLIVWLKQLCTVNESRYFRFTVKIHNSF
jgi:hypothetical protein